MQLLSSIPSLTFPDEWEALTISTSTPLRCLISVNGHPALDLTLRPINGQITLHDAGSLIRDRAERKIAVVKLEVIKDSNRTTLITSTVIPVQNHMGETAAAFTARSFLTFAPPVKLTHRAATERLAWVGSETAVAISSVWWTAHGAVEHTESIAASQKDGANVVDVSPARLNPPEAGAVLCHYAAACGARRQRYEIAPPNTSQGGGAEIEFRNDFGVADTVHAFGTVERNAKPTYKTARIAGRRHNYETESEVTITCYFTPLGTDTRQVESVTQADEVVLLPMRTPIMPVEAEIKCTDDTTKINHATVKFRVEEETPSTETTTTGKRYKIFDDSFDNSYE